MLATAPNSTTRRGMPSSPQVRARWAETLRKQDAAAAVPLEERRRLAKQDKAALEARLGASIDADRLAVRVSQIKRGKGQAAERRQRKAEAYRTRKEREAAAGVLHSGLDFSSRGAGVLALQPPASDGAAAATEQKPALPESSGEEEEAAAAAAAGPQLPEEPADEPTEGPQEPEPAGGPPLDGWHCVEAKSGRAYYLNTLTQHAQWSPPKLSAAEHARAGALGRAETKG